MNNTYIWTCSWIASALGFSCVTPTKRWVIKIYNIKKGEKEKEVTYREGILAFTQTSKS